jgi:hypothetical protein
VKTTITVIVGIVIGTLGAVATAQTMSAAWAAGEPQRETRALEAFSRIEVGGVAEILLRQGKTESATVEASAELLPRIRTRVRDGTLYVDVSQERRWSDWTHLFESQPTPRITIDFIRLEGVEAGGVIKLMADGLRADNLHLDFSGASTIRIRNVQASSLHIEGSGATKIELSGKVSTQDVELSGASSYAALDMESDRAELQVSGAGKAYVNVKTSLSVEISGAGLVEYLGNPKLDKDISGVGKVRRREPD